MIVIPSIVDAILEFFKLTLSYMHFERLVDGSTNSKVHHKVGYQGNNKKDIIDSIIEISTYAIEYPPE